MIGPAPSWTLPSEQERRLLFGAVGTFLANIASPAGVLLVLDDLHWSGSDAIDLLAALSRDPHSWRLRIVAAYRDTDVAAREPLPLLLGDLTREGLATRISLPPLERGHAKELLGRLLSGESDTSGEDESQTAVTDTVLDRASGLPFFLVSWAQELRTAEPSPDVARTTVPWSAAESIRQRVAILPEDAVHLLAIAAVAGRQVSRKVLLTATKASGQREADILTMLDLLCHARLLVETADASYTFAHDLIRETVALGLSSARRAAFHRLLASALENQVPSGRQAAELAWHFAEGDEPAQALPYALQAGEQAETVFAHMEAEQHFRRAVELARACGDRPRQAKALEQLADVLWATGNFQEMPALLDAAAAIHRQARNLDQFAWDIAAATRPYAILGQSDVAFARLQQLLETLAGLADIGMSPGGETSIQEPDGAEVAQLEPPAQLEAQEAGSPLPDSLLNPPLTSLESLAARAVTHLSARSAGRVYSSIAVCLSYQQNYRHAIPFGERAVRYTALAGERWLEVRARMFLANALEKVGRPAQARVVILAARQVAQEAGDLEGVSLLTGSLGELLVQSGALADGARAYEQALDAAQSYGGPDALAQIYCGLARIALYRGAWDETLSSCHRALTVMAAHGFGSYSADVALLQGMVSLYRGERQMAHAYLDQAIQNSLSQRGGNANDPTNVRLQVDTALSEADLLQDGAAAARARLEPWLERTGPHERMSTMLLPLLAWAWSKHGEVERADALLAECLEQTREHQYDLVFVDALRVQAMLALCRDAWGEAEHALGEALSRSRAMSHLFAEAKVLYVYGQLHATRDETERAFAMYQSALDILQHLGERLYAGHIERALANGR
jgi:tetratricopeptide (TPR) repeat protein